MFEWAIIFTVLALIAYTIGVSGIAIAIAPAADLFFYGFIAAAIIFFIAGFFPKKRTKGLIIDIKYGDRGGI